MGIVLIVYGMIVLGGGVMGFKTAGSKASLIMGSAAGILLAVAGATVILGNRNGGYLGAGVTAALILVFARRWSKTKKMMPAGLMLSISVIVAAFLYTEIFS